MGKKNTFYTKEKWEEVNPNNKFLLDDYRSELEVQGKSKGTIYQYTSDIRNFLCWVVDHAKNEDVLEMKRRPFRDFFLVMQRNGSSAARVNRMQSSIRNMLAYAYDNEDEYELDKNVMDSIKGLESQPVREIIWLKNDEVEYLIDYCINEQNDLQKALYISLAYDSGGRRNELYQVTKESFYDEKRRYTNEVVGKRGKIFPLVYSKHTRDLAIEYLKNRGDDQVDSLWVTTDQNGDVQQVSYSTLLYWVTTLRQPYADKYGEYKDFNSHSFRHSALEELETGRHRMLKELGKDRLDIEMLKEIANHEQIDTTRGYLISKSSQEFNSLFGIE